MKWFQSLIILFNINRLFALSKVVKVLLFNSNYSIQHYSFTCIQSNTSMYCYVIPIILLSHTVKVFQVLLFNTNYSIKHLSFICTRLNGTKYCYVSLTIQLYIKLNDQTVLFLTIRFSISHLFGHSLYMYIFFFKQMNYIVNWITTTRKYNKHFHATYRNTGPLFLPN